VRRIFDADYVRQLKPEIARSLTRKLEPFLNDSAERIPDDLRAEIRANYASASEGLGRQGIMVGWEQVFHTREEDLGKIDKNADADRWASTASILAAALLEAGDQFGVNDLIERAIVLYQAIIDLLARDRVPLDWAMTQNNLGNALRTLGERESGTARLEEAVAAYRAALQEWTRERVPLDWAATQNNLGNALMRLGGARERDGASGGGGRGLSRGA
jgi:tetratricopeptide (TPR) repeat protein